MNSKMIVGLVVVVLLIVGGFVLLKGNKQSPQTIAPSAVQPTQQSAQVTPVSTESSSPSGSMTNEKAVTVTLTSSGFDPATITVKAGTKVTWVNKSGVEATVNSDKHPTHLLYTPLNLGSFVRGASLSLVFDKPGSYGYHNHLDPSQTGTVVVE